MIKETIVKRLNDLIVQAVLHGGDSDGPFDSNERGLIDSMKQASYAFDLDKYTIKEVEVFFVGDDGCGGYVTCFQFVK